MNKRLNDTLKQTHGKDDQLKQVPLSSSSFSASFLFSSLRSLARLSVSLSFSLTCHASALVVFFFLFPSTQSKEQYESLVVRLSSLQADLRQALVKEEQVCLSVSLCLSVCLSIYLSLCLPSLPFTLGLRCHLFIFSFSLLLLFVGQGDTSQT
jgi:hypothetical protein